MSNVLRRVSLARLLLLCGVATAIAAGAAALALALGTGPVPPPKPLAQAVQDALQAPKVEGVSARIQFTNHLLEGSELAGAGADGESGQLSSSPLVTGASGRLWVDSEGRARLELQSEKGDTQILYDGRRLSMYDASSNTLYKLVPSGEESPPASESQPRSTKKVPSVSEIQHAIDRLDTHAIVSEAQPTDVAGQPAYTVRISPREHGGLIAGAELSWDANSGAPLRAAVYSTSSSSPVLELSATEVSYGPVASSTLDFQAPSTATVKQVKLPAHRGSQGAGEDATGSPPDRAGRLNTHGQGLEGIAVLEAPAKSGEKSDEGEGEDQPQGFEQVQIGNSKASVLPTQLGTLLSFERAGMRYLLVGSVTPAAIEAFARSL